MCANFTQCAFIKGVLGSTYQSVVRWLKEYNWSNKQLVLNDDLVAEFSVVIYRHPILIFEWLTNESDMLVRGWKLRNKQRFDYVQLQESFESSLGPTKHAHFTISARSSTQNLKNFSLQILTSLLLFSYLSRRICLSPWNGDCLEDTAREMHVPARLKLSTGNWNRLWLYNCKVYVLLETLRMM